MNVTARRAGEREGRQLWWADTRDEAKLGVIGDPYHKELRLPQASITQEFRGLREAASSLRCNRPSSKGFHERPNQLQFNNRVLRFGIETAGNFSGKVQ